MDNCRRSGPTRPRGDSMEHEEIVLHGHRVSYRQAGWGPVIVLIHGITGSSVTLEDVIEPLAENYTVVAPDLLGHGESAKPRGDYSLGAYASGIRDLLAALGHDRATVVGHSLGGGIAMQMAYQFPERVDRLVLVSSGGLGRENDPVIPFRHGIRATERTPGSRLVSFPDAGHFPHRDDPRRFVRELTSFMEETEPSRYEEDRLREMLREGA